MARVARGRRAQFVRADTGWLRPADAASTALLATAAQDVAAWLGYDSVAAYEAATDLERYARIQARRFPVRPTGPPRGE